jgi:Ca-activated chloride channel family protein
MNAVDALFTQPWFWARPWGWALLVVPLLLAALRAWRARRLRALALTYADADLLPFAVRLPAARAGWGAFARDVLIWSLLAAAAAGPRQPLAESGSASGLHRVAVMALLDAGAGQAQTNGAPISPLEQQRLLLAALTPQLHGERIGLFAYGATPAGALQAAQLLPPTVDAHLLAWGAAQARPALFADSGGATLPQLIALVQQRLLQQADGEPGALLLFAGSSARLPADFDPEAAGGELRRAHMPLFVLALPDLPADTRAGLAQWARASGGALHAVAAGQTDAAAWDAVYARGIARLPTSSSAPTQVVAWRDLSPGFLLPALALLLASVWPWRRAAAGAALGLALGMALLQPEPARAQPVTPNATAPASALSRDQLALERAAYAAWQRGDFATAQRLYARLPGFAARLGEGAAAYRQREFQTAAHAFRAALLLADTPAQRFAALFNLGDAAMHLPGGTLEAAQAFDAALRIRPHDPAAQRNAHLARRQYEVEHPPDYLVGIAKRGPPIHRSRFGQQSSNTPSQMRKPPPKTASAPLQQAAPLAGGRITAGATESAAGAAAAWQVPVLDWAGMDKRVQLLRDASAELQQRRADIDTRAAAALGAEGGR